jgi:molecular chaperone DnaK
MPDDRVIRPYPLNLGIETENGSFTPVVGGDWVRPARGSLIFTTFTDNQTRIKVRVLQGESDRAVDNRGLAKLELTGITPALKGVVDIEATLAIDADGTVSVSAQELPNGPRNSMTLRMSPAPEEPRPGVGYL